MRMIRPGRGVLPALFVLLSCSDPSGVRTPTSITLVAGGGQSAVVASVLPQDVMVEVKDVDGVAVRGVTVTWTVTQGGGSASAATTTTNSAGRASVQWTLGTASGENRLTAGVAGVAPLPIIATGNAGAPTGLTIEAGNDQTGITGMALGAPIAVRVADSHGNGVPGVTVVMTAGAGSAAPGTATTNANGTAQAQWTLGSTPGAQTLQAGMAALPAQTVEFTATALAPADVPELVNGVQVNGAGALKGESRYYRITLPEDVTTLQITTTGGSGDADMFVRRGALPATIGNNACESLSPTSTESCTLDSPAGGDWYVQLYAYSTFANVAIEARHMVGGSMDVAVTGLPDGASAAITITGPAHYQRDVAAATTLASLIPGTYTITASRVLGGGSVYAGVPEVQQVEVAEAELVGAQVTYGATSGVLNLDIAGAYITQAVQRRDGSIPLIAGRAGLLRVFVRGDAVSMEAPAVRARFYSNGALIDTRTITAPGGPVPISHDEGQLGSTWNVVLPGTLIQPGVSMVVDVDPANGIAEADEDDNSWPASGTPVALNVRSAPVLRTTLIPVVQKGTTIQGDVTQANAETYLTLARALYPLADIDVEVRAPYSFDGTLQGSSYDSVWVRMLIEINVLRMTEAPDRYYYGVLRPSYQNGGTGYGYIAQPAAIGVDWTNWRAETVAHEWGHNFGRHHVACGGPSGPDPDYPYEGGRIGHHGYDIRTHEIRPLESTHDLMSYCSPTWSSDYTYEAVMNFRGTAAGPGAAAVKASAAKRSGGYGAAPERSLLVWGRLTPEGVVLEPAFEVMARPTVPSGSGRYRLTGVDDRGATVLDISFDGEEIDHAPGVRTFAYTIPLRVMGGEAPSELRLRAGGTDVIRRPPARAARAGADDVRAERDRAGVVRLRWDVARNPVLMVRDASTGEIISFARSGDARIATGAAEIDVNMSDGVKSTMRRVTVVR